MVIQTPACGGCCTRLKALSVRVGSTQLLENISLHVHCGELTFFIGSNGAGKTTLFKAILGQIPYSGSLEFTHNDRTTEFIKPRIGYVPQKFRVDAHTPLTVAEFLASSKNLFPSWLTGKVLLSEETLSAVEAVGAGGLLNKRLGTLSGGELQRVLLALALAPRPHLLLLDEPASNLDHKAALQLYALVSDLRSKFDLAVLIVSHDLPAVAQFADRVVLLQQKVLAEGHPDMVFALPEVKEIFGFTVDANRRGILPAERHIVQT